jgi:hypothetical protein
MRTPDVFPSKYVKAADIGDKEVKVTITSVSVEEVGDDEKPVARFKKTDKGLVLNRTNWDRIALIAGTDESDEWVGLEITLYTELVSYAGKTAPAVRVKKPPRSAPPQQQSTHSDIDDEIPF